MNGRFFAQNSNVLTTHILLLTPRAPGCEGNIEHAEEIFCCKAKQ